MVAGVLIASMSAFQESLGIAAHHLFELRPSQGRLKQLEQGALAGEIGRVGTEDNPLYSQRRPLVNGVARDQLPHADLSLDVGNIDHYPGLCNQVPADRSA